MCKQFDEHKLIVMSRLSFIAKGNDVTCVLAFIYPVLK